MLLSIGVVLVMVLVQTIYQFQVWKIGYKTLKGLKTMTLGTNTTSTNATSIREYPGESSFLPLFDWEKPNTQCDSKGNNTPRPHHVPSYCCYGGQAYLRKQRDAECENHTAELIHRLETTAKAYHSSCNECTIFQILQQNNWTLTLMGDSVSHQTFIGLECTLRARQLIQKERKIRHRWSYTNDTSWWKFGIHEVHVLPLPQNRGRLVFVLAYRRPHWGADFTYVVQNSDILMFDHGLHWSLDVASQEEFRQEMTEYLRSVTMASQSPLKLLLWRGTSPQHHDTPGGYYQAAAHHPNRSCVPNVGNLNNYSETSTEDYRVPLMKNASAEIGLEFLNAFDPGFLSTTTVPLPSSGTSPGAMPRELIHVEFRSYALPLYYAHLKGTDCTHFCNNRHVWPSIWKGLRLAMDRMTSSLGGMGDDSPRGAGFGKGNFSKIEFADEVQ